MRNSKGKSKKVASLPKKPLLGSVRGDYVIPSDVCSRYNLEHTLQIEARLWTKVDKIIDYYFKNTKTWQNSGKDILKDLINNLKAFSRNSNEREAVKTYANEVAKYLDNKEVRNIFCSYYEVQAKKAEVKRLQLLARLEGDSSGAILSTLGAKKLAEQELQLKPRSSMDMPNIEVTKTTPATHNHVEDEFSIVCQSTPLPDNSDVNGSFLSDDYHPTRTYKHTYEYIPDWPDCEEEEEWIIDDVNICQELKQFRATSSHLTTTQGNIRDIRILSLYLIFPFMLSTSDSVTKYMPQSTRVLVKNELNRLYSAAPVPSTNLLVWSNTLRTLRVGWMEMKKKCNEIINDAIKAKDTNDLIASFILFELVPRLTKEVDADETGEDTFVKNYIDCFFDNIFSVDDHFYQSWANIVLINTNDSQYKPDWFAYVKPWIKKFKLATCEIKPPSKVGRGDISDFVKLGIEMRDMLDEILSIGVDDASVFGILIEGKQVSTYAMNTKSGVFRMIQLGEYNAIEKLSELGHFPALFTGLMQVKNIALNTARAIEKTERENSRGKKRERVDRRKSAGSIPTLKKLRPST